jgi:hypothetical protein
MIIMINTSAGPLSESDKAALRALVGATTPEPSAADVVKEDRKAEQAKAAPVAKKAAPAAKKAAAPAPEPEPDEDSSEDGEDALEAAVSRATALVKEGKIPLVKKALAAAGAKKVSELTADQVDDFVAALDEE